MFWNQLNSSLYPSKQALGLAGNTSIVPRAFGIGGPTRRCGAIGSCMQARYSTALGKPTGPPVLSSPYDIFARPFYKLGAANGEEATLRRVDTSWTRMPLLLTLLLLLFLFMLLHWLATIGDKQQ